GGQSLPWRPISGWAEGESIPVAGDGPYVGGRCAGCGARRGDGRGAYPADGHSAAGARPGPAGGAGPRSPPPGRRSAARGRRRGPRQRLGPRVGSSPRGVQGSAVEEPCPLLRSFCTESSGFGWLRPPKNPERREKNRLTVTSRTPSATV